MSMISLISLINLLLLINVIMKISVNQRFRQLAGGSHEVVPSDQAAALPKYTHSPAPSQVLSASETTPVTVLYLGQGKSSTARGARFTGLE